MNLEIDELLKEINKFKENVTSSNSLTKRIEDSIQAIKDASKNTEREGTHYLSSIKDTCDAVVSECKKAITNTKEDAKETIEKVKNIYEEISSKCNSLIEQSKALVENTKEKYTNIEKMMTDLSKNYTSYKKGLTIALILIGCLSLAGVILGILNLVL